MRNYVQTAAKHYSYPAQNFMNYENFLSRSIHTFNSISALQNLAETFICPLWAVADSPKLSAAKETFWKELIIPILL
jgi:hypothetical protein